MILTYLLLALVSSVLGQKEGDACTEQYTNAAGICRPVSHCKIAKQDFQESGIKPTFCAQTLFGDALVCCRDGLNIFETPATARTVDPPVIVPEKDTRRVSERKCDEYSRQASQKVDYLLLLQEPQIFSISFAKCAIRPASLKSQRAELGELPHMVAVGRIDTKNKYHFICGGSLISHRFVLTAAQCFIIQPREVNGATFSSDRTDRVRLGDRNLGENINDGATPIDIIIRRRYSHPNYKLPKRYNDIGLIELVSDVDFNYNIRPACLWTKPNLAGYDKVIAPGWNLRDNNRSSREKALEMVSINVYENKDCDPLLVDYRNRNWLGFNESQMCAGELYNRNKWDSCLNEPGSPLQITARDYPCISYVVGITSYGLSCERYNVPSVYTRVSTYIDWIEEIVWPSGN